ncbi:hypothetical protein SAMN06297422_10684 [Lachnospiraceae bacterium]|nr:hypothetical protein SAMN06297422_10684 [Lachnospiraceae bacterium]
MMDLSMAIIKSDLIMAKQGIDLFKNKGIKEIKNQTAYHLQQAIEKLIKIQVYSSGVAYNNRSMYVHNISSLTAYADGLNINVDIPTEVRNNAINISDWEASGRYDLHFSVRIDTLEKYYKVATDWYNRLYKNGIR